MKKTGFLLALIISLISFYSCSSGSPESTAIESIQYMIDGKYEKLVDNLFIPESYKNDEIRLKKFKEDKVNLFKELREDKSFFAEISENGGLKKLITTKNSDGETVVYNDEKTKASVWVSVVCKNGDTISMGRTPMSIQDGKWKLDID